MNWIYYFTGTGNTLFAAKKFAEALGENTKLISIASLDRAQTIEIPENVKTVGIFFPVYCFGLPQVVRRFVSRITVSDRKVYFYSCCTSGGVKGYASQVLQEALKRRKIALDAAFHLKMPSNYIAFTAPPKKSRCEKLYRDAVEKIQRYAAIVKARRKHHPLRVFPFDLWGELVAKNAVSYLSDYDKYFWLNENCDGCETCEKVCPAANIIIRNHMPTWRNHCEQCMACLQWCPKQAIQFRQTSVKRARYHHPEITVEEVINRRKDN